MNRDHGLDFVRVVSCFLVIMTHVSAYWSYKFQPEWEIVNFYNSLSRCAVPVFVMISGIFLIKRDIDLYSFYKAKLPKSVLFLMSWSIFYYVIFTNNDKSISDFVITLFSKQTMYHLWYLYFIIGMYLFTPLISVIYYSMTHRQLLITLTLVLIIYQTNLISSIIGINIAGKFNLSSFLTLNWYMLIGKYIYENVNHKFSAVKIMCIFFAAIIATSYLNSLYSHYVGNPVSTFLDNYAINTAIAGMSVLLLSKVKLSGQIKKYSSIIAPYTFGMYCIHPAILIPLRQYAWEYRWGGDMIYYLPTVCLIMFFLSLLATFIIKKTPFIKNCC